MLDDGRPTPHDPYGRAVSHHPYDNNLSGNRLSGSDIYAAAMNAGYPNRRSGGDVYGRPNSYLDLDSQDPWEWEQQPNYLDVLQDIDNLDEGPTSNSILGENLSNPGYPPHYSDSVQRNSRPSYIDMGGDRGGAGSDDDHPGYVDMGGGDA